MIREAILKAANSIEQYPELFDFGSVRNPNHECGTPGCAFGWIAFHAGVGEWAFNDDLYSFMGFEGNDDDERFYERLDELNGGCDWRFNSVSCANALRFYADKYHPEEEKGTWDALSTIWIPLGEKV